MHPSRCIFQIVLVFTVDQPQIGRRRLRLYIFADYMLAEVLNTKRLLAGLEAALVAD